MHNSKISQMKEGASYLEVLLWGAIYTQLKCSKTPKAYVFNFLRCIFVDEINRTSTLNDSFEIN